MLPSGQARLFVGDAATKLRENGFINVVIVRHDEQLIGVSVTDIESTDVPVRYLRPGAKPNTSPIVGIWVEGEYLCAQHWDGFLSRLDAITLELVTQEFTK